MDPVWHACLSYRRALVGQQHGVYDAEDRSVRADPRRKRNEADRILRYWRMLFDVVLQNYVQFPGSLDSHFDVFMLEGIEDAELLNRNSVTARW